jgi:hypothetical protein
VLDPITMACGIATSAVAMCICLRDWLGPLVGRRQPVEKLLVEWERPAWQVILEREQNQRMREAGLKCSVVNGRVVRDREI